MAEILDEGALCHLQGDELGCDPPRLAQRDQAIAQISLDQADAGEVHRQPDGRAGCLPALQIPQALLDEALGQGADEAALLGQGDEARGRYHAKGRVQPAGQRLHPQQLAGGEAHLGLIPGHDFSLICQRPGQLGDLDERACPRLLQAVIRYPVGEQLGEPPLAGGFIQTAEHPQAIGVAHAPHRLDHVLLEGAHQYDATAKPVQGEAAQQCHAIHTGHAQIAEEDIYLLLLAQGQRCLAIRGLQRYPVTQGLDLVHQYLALKGVVFHHQKGNVRGEVVH
ncbi:hypothetical protein D3C79_453830 [compost metagenome]